MTYHRTFGQTRDCRGCRHWSEMIAMAQGGGPVKALCLSQDGPRRGEYLANTETCTSWASGHLGAVDDPPDGNDYRGEPTECPKQRR